MSITEQQIQRQMQTIIANDTVLTRAVAQRGDASIHEFLADRLRNVMTPVICEQIIRPAAIADLEDEELAAAEATNHGEGWPEVMA